MRPWEGHGLSFSSSYIRGYTSIVQTLFFGTPDFKQMSDIYPEKLLQKDSCTLMFKAALFTIAKTWKQPKYPLTEEWIKKMWCIYTMEYYSAIKKNKIMPFVATWMNSEIIVLGERSHLQKTTCMILFI